MMGDRLIGEAPEYTLEQWLRFRDHQIWPHVLDAPAFSHLQATLDALQRPMKRRAALQQVFANLMTPHLRRCLIITVASAPHRALTVFD